MRSESEYSVCNADVPVPQIPLLAAKHVAEHVLASIIDDTVLQRPQPNPFSSLVTLSNGSSSGADPSTPDALAPDGGLNNTSSLAVVFGVSAFVVLIGTYPWWRSCIAQAFLSNGDKRGINNVPSFVKMNTVNTSGSRPISDGDEAFWSAEAGTHDQTPSMSQPSKTQGSPRSSSLSVSSDEQSLPFPLRFRQDGGPSVQYLRIYSMTAKVLKQHCIEFNLSQTGNKTVLVERLEAFSHNPDSWNSAHPGAHRSHKGPRVKRPTDKPRTSRTKKSTQRRAQLVPGANTINGTTTITDRSKDARTSAEVAALLPWAKMICMEYPYQTTDGMAPVADAEPSHYPMGGMPTGTSAHSASYINELQDTIIQNASTRLISLVQDALLQPGAAASPHILGAEEHRAVAPRSTDAITSGHSMVREAPTPAKPDTNKARVLKLGDGTTLQLDDGDIPDPPAISFANDISSLNEMWDDHTEHWRGISIIVIQGHPIAIEHWPVLYRYGRDQQWKGTKNKWTDWRDIVECYRQSSPEEFWAKFSVDGEHATFTTIVQKLRDARKAAHSRIVQQAHEEFGPAFDAHFTYRRGGRDPSPDNKVFYQPMAATVDSMQCFPGLCGVLSGSATGLEIDEIEEDVAAEQETIIEPGAGLKTANTGSIDTPDFVKLQMTLMEASKGVTDGTDAEYKRWMLFSNSPDGSLMLFAGSAFWGRMRNSSARDHGLMLLCCDSINLDGTTKLCSQERGTYGHAQKMRASMTYGFGKLKGLGNMPWHESDVGATMVGNPSISVEVSSFMCSLRRRKVQAGEVANSARAITSVSHVEYFNISLVKILQLLQEILLKLYHHNRLPENWTVQPYQPGERKPAGGSRTSDSLDNWGGGRVRRLLHAAYTVAFLCMLRFDEVLKIQVHDLRVANNQVVLYLPFRKTHQNGDIKPFHLWTLSSNEAHLCPTRALAAWFDESQITTGYVFRKMASGDRIAVANNPMSSEQFLELFRNNLLDINIDPAPYGTHSFRRGGCQYLHIERRWPLRRICEWGGWSTEFTNMTIVKYLISSNDDPAEPRDHFFNPNQRPAVKCPQCGRCCLCA
ncbi:uncharacterized protein EDB91DRAFT_1343747 [Suillus paluster]|uniref:uncharacterized protein n=1 Tax=Suillus paluster TaxID=48578 RepID=UPI001B882D30|nr:uncharacterized protein EDB91DRAFT_1343747 [Suillus paluster]KAG1752751.1 hypothetical protein EDB91DRAFT_1343747 [Suillus paluster]